MPDSKVRVVEYVRPRSLEEDYVAAGELPRIKEAEGSWSSAIATVLVALLAAATLLEGVGYHW